MNQSESTAKGKFGVAYLALSGTTTSSRCPENLRGLVALGFPTLIAIPMPNAACAIAPRELAAIDGARAA
jgi:hypothetical protein